MDHSKIVVTPISSIDRPAECSRIDVIFINPVGKKHQFCLNPDVTAEPPPEMESEVKLKTSPESRVRESDGKGTEGCAFLSSYTKPASVQEKEENEALEVPQEVARRLSFLLDCLPKLLKL